MRRLFIHVLIALGFGALAIAWTFPLVLRLSTDLPGAGVGDNALFLWNFWWMRAAGAAGSGFFHTTYLFAPGGADITLHTNTALPAFIGATLLGRLSTMTALNVTTIASLALNGFCAYLLAWRIVGKRGPAILAGIIFGTSPYIAAHLNGHFNLTTAWTIPLFALCVTNRTRPYVSFAVGGLVLAATAYVDYYYLVYEFAFAAVVAIIMSREWRAARRAKPASSRWLAVLTSLIALDVLLIVATKVTGGFTTRLGPVPLSMHDSFNLAQLLSLLVAVAIWVRFGPVISSQRIPGWTWVCTAKCLTAMVVVFLLCIAPLLQHAIHLFADGQYVSQRYQWRNGPVGIDVLTLILGNPFHALWGGAVAKAYAHFGINLIESGAWLGIVPLALLVVAVRKRWADPDIQLWAALGCVFFVWALGSHIHAAGHTTGLIMPEVLLRYVPVAANARMPGRAMVIVYLALAMLAAIGAARTQWRRPAAAVTMMAALTAADFWISPLPTVPATCPPIYQQLRGRPETGALAELPLGIADGFGEVTPADYRMLVCQTVHERPLVGGVLARLPPGVLAAYRADPLIAAWLRLSGAKPDVVAAAPLPDAIVTADRLKADGIAFVMLNRRTASSDLRDFVEHVMHLTVIAQDEERTLYRSDSDKH